MKSIIDIKALDVCILHLTVQDYCHTVLKHMFSPNKINTTLVITKETAEKLNLR